MTLDIRDGAMSIDAQGREILNTRNKLLHTLTPRIVGQRDFGAIASGKSVINRVDTFVLGACHPACTFVYGSVKFYVSGTGNGFPFNRWHSVFGEGILVWVHDGEPGFRKRLGSNLGMQQFCGYSVRASNGQVLLDRTLYLADTPLQYVIRPHSITYRLKAGCFT